MLSWLKKKIDKYVTDKQVDNIWKVMGVSQDLREANDHGSLRSYSVEIEMPNLNGFKEDVRIARTKDGVLLLKKQSGEAISGLISISSEALQKIPSEIDEGVFAHLIIKSKYPGQPEEIKTCFIARDGTPYGDLRAFWWSLAKGTLNGEFLKINNTRLTDKAFAQVRAAANGIWESAVKNDGSIENMRDTLVLLRNKHLDVFANLKTQYNNKPSVKFGIDIAQAMVLATQSEDPNLEGLAFERLKKFIWEPGQEPEDFLTSHG